MTVAGLPPMVAVTTLDPGTQLFSGIREMPELSVPSTPAGFVSPPPVPYTAISEPCTAGVVATVPPVTGTPPTGPFTDRFELSAAAWPWPVAFKVYTPGATVTTFSEIGADCALLTMTTILVLFCPETSHGTTTLICVDET